jgi:uncharacterized membrane protein
MKALGLGSSLALALLTADAHAQAVQMTERPDHTTEARVIVDASPAEVYALVTNYASWPQVLGDVSSVKVESGGRENARVRFKSRAIGQSVTVVFANDPAHSIEFRGVEGPPGGRARGEYVLTPIDGGKRTQVVATLYLDIKGAAGLFVRDAKIEGMRRQKLRSDMEDVARYFNTRRPSAGASPSATP